KEYIQKFKYSDWWERLFGADRPDGLMISDARTDVRIRLFLEASGQSGATRIPFDLKRLKGGIKRTTFGTVGDGPLRVKMVLDNDAKRLEFGLRFTYPHPDVQATRDLTTLFMHVQRGASLRVALPSGLPLGNTPLHVSSLPSMNNLEAWDRLLPTLLQI